MAVAKWFQAAFVKTAQIKYLSNKRSVIGWGKLINDQKV
jgi:hypothetical protein